MDAKPLMDANPWKDAVIEACIVNCIDWDEQDPVKTLAQLIAWEVKIALDPAVSADARALIERGRLGRPGYQPIKQDAARYGPPPRKR